MPVMKYYGEPEEFVSHVEKPVITYAPGGYRLITAGQYDLPYNYGYDLKGFSEYPFLKTFPQLNWHKI